MPTLGERIDGILQERFGLSVETADSTRLYQAISLVAMRELAPRWHRAGGGKRAAYFSAEFLLGRMTHANLLNMGQLDELYRYLNDHGLDLTCLEEIEDMALGNGGLGRLAACFLDAAASLDIPLDGYGIRYRYGLFRQSFEDGFQREEADDWTRFGDPWSVRREDQRVTVRFRNQTVYAVPYDMPVVGAENRSVNTLRLWQAEAVEPFDFERFNAQKYDAAVRSRDRAEIISAALYPNDDTVRGKKLRLKQQYFFTSASLQDMLYRWRTERGGDLSRFDEAWSIQLNDTHPAIALPEFVRLLMQEGVDFDTALATARRTFAYTNHTVLPEALETWSAALIKSVIPQVYPVLEQMDRALRAELEGRGVSPEGYALIEHGTVHMARLAVWATHSTNGVAPLHTEILKENVLHNWYELYPERFNNKTNGITQRRWLALANPDLTALIAGRIGEDFLSHPERMEQLRDAQGDMEFLRDFAGVKQQNKRRLASFLEQREGVAVDAERLFDVQVKRLHEYKRQLLNALVILDTCHGILDGRITDFAPTLYLFGAKAAPGYRRAKGIIKFIHEISAFVASEPRLRELVQVLFVTNYDVSYAEKIMPAADVSVQISAAGTEASGTGNMKLMMNGAVTFGTMDGANVEIVRRAGLENNYIFGADVDEIRRLGEHYDPREFYENSPDLRRAMDALVSGRFSDGGSGIFAELYASLLEGASWHRPDPYFVCRDFESCRQTRLRLNRDYRDREAFTRKCLLNTAASGWFSADRTVTAYARDIWRVATPHEVTFAENAAPDREPARV